MPGRECLHCTWVSAGGRTHQYEPETSSASCSTYLREMRSDAARAGADGAEADLGETGDSDCSRCGVNAVEAAVLGNDDRCCIVCKEQSQHPAC